MLIRINDDYVVKSDTYSFRLCEDKGMTKFPGGFSALYYKPLYHYRNIGPIAKKLENISIAVPVGLLDVIKVEDEIKGMINENCNVAAMKLGDIILSTMSNCCSIKVGSYTCYPSKIKHALYDLWSFYLKCDDRFGFQESYNPPEFSTFDEILKASEEYKNTLEKLNKLVVD